MPDPTPTVTTGTDATPATPAPAGRRPFVGQGRLDGHAPAWRTEVTDAAQTGRLIAAGRLDDPADYESDPGLVDAMNVALLLGRPLLLTGKPGTGKSQFADRVAWEFDLAPVLRFEAKSVSEAQDLFYRFDMVGRLAVAQPGMGKPGDADVRRFIRLEALGKAVLYSLAVDAEKPHGLGLEPPHPAPATGRASVVLIDEIDKASRDFPNDLLGQIERMALRVPEIDGHFEASRDPSTRPIVVITSNSERELPEPFLRRCVYYHIVDPTTERLRRIVQSRVIARTPALQLSSGLPKLFHQLVKCFVDYRDLSGKRLVFTPGTSELLDLTKVVAGDGETRPTEALGDPLNRAALARAVSAVAKGKGDAAEFVKHVQGWQDKD